MPKGCISSRCASGAHRDTTERKGLLCFCSLSQNVRDGPEFCPGSLLVWSSPQSGTARLGFQAELLGIITKQSLKFGCELLQKGVFFFFPSVPQGCVLSSHSHKACRDRAVAEGGLIPAKNTPVKTMLCSFLQATYNHSLSVCVPVGTQQTRISSTLLLLACCGAVGSHFCSCLPQFPPHGKLLRIPGLVPLSHPSLTDSRKAFPALITFCGFCPEEYLKRLGFHQVANKVKIVSCYGLSGLALLPSSYQKCPPCSTALN